MAQMSILVLSCDKYSDLWEDFFNLKEKFWQDCSFKSYLVTESVKYSRPGVSTITFPNHNWSGRLREAIKVVDTPYVCIFLDDFFIYKDVNNDLIQSLLEFCHENHVSYLNLSDVFDSILGDKNKEYYNENEVIISKHKKYGVSTAAGIWDTKYLLKKLGDGEYSAWQFEVDRCNEALSEDGMDGVLLCDKRKPLNVSIAPVVIQGKFYPKAIKQFRKFGYEIDTSRRQIMSFGEILKYDIKSYVYQIRFCRKFIKFIAYHIFRYKPFVRG